MKPNYKLAFLWICLILASPGLNAQITGGNNVFGFLTLSPSARITALGGNIIATRDGDVNLALANPALLNPAMHNQLSFSHSFLPAGIGFGYASFGQALPAWNATMHVGIQYISYGTFDQTDEIGNVTGNFKASEYAMTIGIGRELYERVSIGANLKLISSQFESYNSLGIAADIAAVFHDTASNINLSFVLRNMGSQLTSYNDGPKEDLPFEMQLGLSKRLRYLPFRFSIIYQYLNVWNISYNDPASEDDIFSFGDEASTGTDFLDKLARHFIFNGEFLFGKNENFRLRFGYNHLQRKELTVQNLRSLSGFSMGFGIKINRFRLDYGRSFVHLGAGMNHLSIATNLKEFW